MSLPDFSAILKAFQFVWSLIFGDKAILPHWMVIVVGIICFLILVVWLGGVLLEALGKVVDLWTQKIWPLFYKAEQKLRSLQRRRFADYIAYEIERLNRQEDWKDYRFAELEAEVEAEGRRRLFDIFSLRNNSLRREKSLSKALASSGELYILVEGEPGSGKSVALRHAALHIARKASRSKNEKSVIPIYVNLKELERPIDTPIDRNLIETFVLTSLKRINDRDVDQFLDDEFRRGLSDGTWFFMFDSFDELPEVLSSTDVDHIVKQYASAIDDFLHGLHRCRGIIASRQFRGPRNLAWPRFRVLALSEKRQDELIHKANLGAKIEKEFKGHFASATQEIRLMASNPLFLTLLCEHMKSGHTFPTNTHVVFESYIANRLKRDEERLQRRYQLDAAQMRMAAEAFAFCMTANKGLGLSPTREKLRAALVEQQFTITGDFETLLDALEFIKLARPDVAPDALQEKSFTFSHRRFQEYFATCVVLREPERVHVNQLLEDARWRETAVVMCQTQPIESLKPLIARAEQLLVQYRRDITNSMYASRSHTPQTGNAHSVLEQYKSFPWPAGLLHLLGLLQDGLANRSTHLITGMKRHANMILLAATKTGATFDTKWALEVGGITSETVMKSLLQKAFASRSQWLKEVAYRQVARVSTITPSLAVGIQKAIVRLYYDGRLRRERYATEAHLKRLPQSKNFLITVRVLLWLSAINVFPFLLLFGIDWYLFLHPNSLGYVFVFLFLVFLLYYILNDTYRLIKNIDFYNSFLSMIIFVLILPWFIGFFNADRYSIPVSYWLFLYFLLCIWSFTLIASIFVMMGIIEHEYRHISWLWVFFPLWPLVWPAILLLLWIAKMIVRITQLSQGKVSTFIILCIRQCILLFKLGQDWLRKNRWKVIWFVLSGMAFFGIMAYLIWVSTIVFSNEIESAITSTLSLPSSLWVVAALCIISLLCCLWLYYLCADQILWRRWSKNHQKNIEIFDFFNIAVAFHFRRLRSRFIKVIREQHLLNSTPETISILLACVMCLDTYWKERDAKVIDQKVLLNNVHGQLSKITCLDKKKVAKLQALGHEFTDSLCVLAEHLMQES